MGTDPRDQGTEVHPQAIEARKLRLAQKHQAALSLLEEGLAREPNEPDLLAEKGLLYCLLQKEDEAVELLGRALASNEAPELASWLWDYVQCRDQMAAKLNVPDAAGKKLASRLAAISPRNTALPQNGNTGIKLSACLIVKNEEKNLERCLQSLQGHVDEIVVVDTGSTDGTLKIAARHGAKVAQVEWTDDFSAARNISLDLATGNWALWIDADEEVAPESWGPIREALIRPHFGGFFVRILNYMDEEGTANTYTHAPVRLFQNKPEIRFAGRVHEQVTPALDALHLPCAHLQGATLHHYGYRPSEMAEKGKLARTIKLLEKEVRESPKDAFHWFNLANTYSVAKRTEDAVHAARMCLKHIHPQNAFGTVAYQILASSLNATGKAGDAFAACEEAEARGFFTILNQFEKAHALLKLARFEEALEAIDACRAMPWDETMTGDYGIVTHKAQTLRGQILCELGRYDESLADLDAALSVDPDFAVALFGKAVTLERSGESRSSLELYHRLLDEPQFEPAALESIVRLANQAGDYAKAAEFGERAGKKYPLHLSSWAGWLGALEALGEPVRRQAAYQAFAEFHEPAPDVLVNWSRALRECGELEAAYNKLQEAVEKDPENSNALFNMGDLLYSCGMFGDAATAYEAGLRYDSDRAEGWFVLGNSFAQLEIWEGARVAYHQALELRPDYEEAKANLAYVDEADQKAA